MKKIALSLSVATLLVAGVTTGCGDPSTNNNAGGQGFNLEQNRDQTGYGGDRLDGQGMGGANYGYGGAVGTQEPDRPGNRAQTRRDRMTQGHNQQEGFGINRGQNRQQGFGANQGRNRQQGFARGFTGNDRQGMVDGNGLLNGAFGGFGQLNRGTDQDPIHGGQGIDRNQPRTGQNNIQNGATGYYESNDGRAARKIENRVEGLDEVRDCNVIVNDDDVLIGVKTRGNNNDDVEDEVRSLVADLDDDLDIHVVTEEDGLNRINDMENRLRGGEPFEEIGSTFNAMLDDLGDAVQRPFQRTR